MPHLLHAIDSSTILGKCATLCRAGTDSASLIKFAITSRPIDGMGRVADKMICEKLRGALLAFRNAVYCIELLRMIPCTMHDSS